MKTNKFLLLIFFLIAIPFSGTCKFIRVYDPEGHLIAKGTYVLVNDTALKIRQKGETVFIASEKITKIILGHGTGHNIAIGAAIGGFLLSLAGIISADPDEESGKGAVTGFLLGSFAGAALGAATTETKKNTHVIFGSMEELKKFELLMRNYL